MMIVLLIFLYLCIGAIVTFALRRLCLLADRNKFTGWGDNSGECIAIGVFWIAAAPFAFAVFFAKYGEELKKRGKAE